jgi:tetratricopeptide (TPR) repeat protein
MLFEDARRSRHNMYERMERDFIALLSVGEVRRLGDALDRVEQFSRERYFTAASAALDELFYRVPRASLNNSANAALEAFGRLKNYPEAEYWIGEVYRVEGELPLALAQYNRAYSMRAVLEDPGFANSLKYRIAGIHRVRHEFGEMENILLMIINNEDPLWFNSNRGDENRTNVSLPFAEASASFARSGMTRILLAEGIDRFLEIYRYNNGVVEQAHRQLGFFYINNGQPSALPHLMFAFLIQNTVIIEELRRRQFDFVYTDLETLIEEVNKNPLLLSYINEVEYFKTAYYLAAALFRNQNTSSEMRIWSFLSTLPQAGEWHQRAVMQLRNPRSEPVLERL